MNTTTIKIIILLFTTTTVVVSQHNWRYRWPNANVQRSTRKTNIYPIKNLIIAYENDNYKINYCYNEEEMLPLVYQYNLFTQIQGQTVRQMLENIFKWLNVYSPYIKLNLIITPPRKSVVAPPSSSKYIHINYPNEQNPLCNWNIKMVFDAATVAQLPPRTCGITHFSLKEIQIYMLPICISQASRLYRIIIHELGHSLGLDHNFNIHKSMMDNLDLYEKKKQFIYTNDVIALRHAQLEYIRFYQSLVRNNTPIRVRILS